MRSHDASRRAQSFVEGPSHIAAGAVPVRIPASGAEPALQDNLVLTWAVKALLTDVVIRLRGAWVAGPAKCWGGIYPISQLAVTDLDKRVAAALCEGFSNFSEFLCGMEVLMLQRVDGSAEFEKTLLGIEQLFVHGPDYVHRFGLVSDGHSPLAEVDGAIDGSDCASDERKVQEGSPRVGNGGVGTTDSTLRGTEKIPNTEHSPLPVPPPDSRARPGE